MLIQRALHLIHPTSFLTALAELVLHLFLCALEPIETLDLSQEFIINPEGLLHGGVPQFVLSAYAFAVVGACVMEAEEEVDESEEVALLCPYLLLCLKDA